MPFVYVMGSFTALLALVLTLMGVDPIRPCLDFLMESTIALTPLVVKLAIFWLVYATAYALALFQYELAAVVPISCAAAAVPIACALEASLRQAASLCLREIQRRPLEHAPSTDRHMGTIISRETDCFIM